MGAITDVSGIKVGHADDLDGLTGCTVALCPPGTVGGLDRRGGGVSTRQTDSLDLMHLAEEVHAVVLAGGSAFGTEASTGVQHYLEERGVGLDVRVTRVPIVPTAILFDLGLGEPGVRPDATMGRAACEAASSDPPQEGNAGAGMGATLGNILGPEGAMKSGVGTASVELGGGVVVGALLAVNPFGDVIDPASGDIVAGARRSEDDGGGFADTREVLRGRIGAGKMGFGSNENTVIGVVATNARLDKRDCTKLAQMAQVGVARSVRPAHTMFDGDALIALATGDHEADVNILGTFAAEVVAEAIQRAVKAAEAAGGLPAWQDLPR